MEGKTERNKSPRTAPSAANYPGPGKGTPLYGDGAERPAADGPGRGGGGERPGRPRPRACIHQSPVMRQDAGNADATAQ